MTIHRIPTTTYPDQRQKTRLDGRAYIMRFRWNERADGWFFDLHTVAGDPILVGVRLALSSRPLAGVLHDARPPGEIIVVDMTGSGVEAAQDDLGTRVQVQYLDAAELAGSA